jgi:alkanesulfonate monooxygenase SsuD/methylene tetrahydromethanopterin reductase-like flavin-dependent oxidoreductase (luciferase family)
MGIPLAGAHMANLIKGYRTAWREAGHPGNGKVMLAFHMYCAPTREEAAAIARKPLNQYLQSIVAAASEWMSGVASRDYPNYQKTIEIISKETFESQVEKGAAWIGTPDEIRNTIADYGREVAGFESASLQVNFGMIGLAEAKASMRLFAREVMPQFAG